MKFPGYAQNRQVTVFRLVVVVLTIGLSFLNFQVPFAYDDVVQIVQNNNLHDFFDWGAILREPFRQNRVIQNLTLSFDWMVSGGQTWSFHLFNNLLHAACTLVLASLLPLIGIRDRLANVLICLLFFIHPIQIESVTYIMGRIELLKTLSTLVLLLLYLQKKNKWVIYAGLIISLLVKETCVLTPCLFLSADYILGTTDLKQIDWKKHLFFFSHALWLIPLRFLLNFDIHGGVVGFELYPYSDYLWTNLHYMYFYLMMFFNPAEQSIFHEWTAHPPLIDVIVGMGIWIFSIVAVFKFRKAKPVVSFLALFFLFSVAPYFTVLQFINPFAEYRLYQSNIILCVAIVLGVYAIPINQMLKFFILGSFAAFLLFFNVLYTLQWQEPRGLWAYALEKYPGSSMSGQNLAFYLTEENRCEESQKILERVCPSARFQKIKNNCAFLSVSNLIGLMKYKEALPYMEALIRESLAVKNQAFYENYLDLLKELGEDAKFSSAHSDIQKIFKIKGAHEKWGFTIKGYTKSYCR